MRSVNRVFLLGNLTRPPELRSLPSGTRVAHLGMAVNRTWKDPESGEKREKPCFLDVRVFGRSAEVAERYLEKGSPLFVEGRVRLDQWETSEGQKRSKLCVVAERFTLLPKRDRGKQSLPPAEDADQNTHTEPGADVAGSLDGPAGVGGTD